MCKYKTKYYDYSAQKEVTFRCRKRAVRDGFCIFHHPEYWKESPKEVSDEFYKKIESALKGNQRLLCIGYNLPDITLYSRNFPSQVYFVGSTFQGIANFSLATFIETHFGEAVFLKEANFFGAKFTYGDFNNATFHRRASFYKAEFVTANFSRTKFQETSFRTAKFVREANFIGAKFQGQASFIETTFQGLVYFREAKFAAGAEFVALQGLPFPILDFQHVTFDNAEKVHFNYVDLSNTSFVGTDVSRVGIGEKVEWKAKKSFDESIADKDLVPYETVATVYRRLRQNLESKLRHTEAGHFFIAEMDVKRKNVKIKNRVLKWLRTNIFSALAWYKYFSNYGESYQRVILWIVLTPLLAAFLTTLSTTPLSLPPNSEAIVEGLTQFSTIFQEHLRNYILAFFQLKTDNMKELAVRILSLLFMGQLYIALRRQFERKYVRPRAE